MIFNRLTHLFQHYKNTFQMNGGESETIISEKVRIRREVRKLKKSLTDEEKQLSAIAVFRKIESRPEFIKAKTILLYWSMPDELPTHDFIKKWSISKSILLPVVIGHHMTIRPFIKEDRLKRNEFNVMQPMTGHDYLEMVDLVIVPGVAFDRKKRRLGRGKGYYDKYLKNKKIKKWGLCYDLQLYDKVPTSSFDITMNKVFTPLEIIE